MASVTPVFLFNSLNVNRGGLTKAIMKRANMLCEHYDRVVMTTLLYQRHHHHIVRQLQETGQLSPKLEVHNCFVALNPYRHEQPSPKDAVEQKVNEKGLTAVRDSKKPKQVIYYHQAGQYVKCKTYTAGGRVKYIHDMNEDGVNIRRREYDPEGYLSRIRYYDAETGLAHYDRYFSQSGRCFLKTDLDPETEAVGRCQLYGSDVQVFANLHELYCYWVDQQLETMEKPVVMSDSRKMDPILLDLQTAGIKRIATLHSNHFKKPYKPGAKTKGSWHPLFRNLSRLDQVIFLTEEQKADVADEYGDTGRFRVIPHVATKVKPKSWFVKRQPHLMVAMARLKPVKRLGQAIRAFSYVAAEMPDARFEIYGSGSERQTLQKLIHELDLQQHVKLMGYTQDPIRCYKSAACTVMTSAFEGSPLVFNESLAAGTPVITYHFKYGAQDMIRDGVDGYLIEDRNPQELADKIVELMSQPALQRKMGRRAKEVTQRFSYKQFTQHWLSLLHDFE